MQRKYSEQDRAYTAWQAAAVHACACALGLEDMEPLGECPDTWLLAFQRGPDRNGPMLSDRLRRCTPRQTFTIGCIGLLGRRASKALIFHVLRSRFSFVAKA